MSRAGLLTLLLLLASCGGGPRRHAHAVPQDQGGAGSFMDVTRSRCAQGDDGACRMLHAMGD